MKTPRKRNAELLVVSSDTKEDLADLEEVVAKVVEDVDVAECGPQKVASLQTSTGIVILETGEDTSAEEAQSKAFSVANVLCVQVLPLLKYLDQKKENEGTLEPVDGGEVPAAEKKVHGYNAELAVRAKKLAEYEAVRISDLELIEKLEIRCSELRSQQMQAKEQLCEMETRLTEAEEKNRQLSEQARDALTARVNQCLRGFVLWQVETHKWLRLRELEHRAAELTARNGRR
ncbi:hypothetical protein AXG93_1593s1150 [Marchantia polymorpha subsp. ruderalis]|uniref:Uncharacterized protein n=1 Tax=Marchantia polymorpha subsp. ruderalis TaxID=1480154 RepID=A0A176WPG2_MARPO|nr:hypothetical protein AXG93_1593s1150 [Marchantia polymorpha subsp. ruderalis]